MLIDFLQLIIVICCSLSNIVYQCFSSKQCLLLIQILTLLFAGLQVNISNLINLVNEYEVEQQQIYY